MYLQIISWNRDCGRDAMSVYNANGDKINALYGVDNTELDKAYDVLGNVVFDDSSERRILFFDDFNSFDSAMWMCEIGNVRNYSSELQCYRAENVSVENSCLVLTAKRESYGGKNWTSGSISGQTLQSFKYGRFEARIKFPNVAGAFGAFWMAGSNFWKEYVDGGRPTNHGTIWPACGEIDIDETIPGNATTAQGNMWTYTGGSMGTGRSGSIISSDWNIYACEWTSEYVAVFVNGTEYKRWTFSDYSSSAVQAYQLPFYMILNLAVGASGGTPASSTSEMKMYVDWVRVYAPLNGS